MSRIWFVFIHFILLLTVVAEPASDLGFTAFLYQHVSNIYTNILDSHTHTHTFSYTPSSPPLNILARDQPGSLFCWCRGRDWGCSYMLWHAIRAYSTEMNNSFIAYTTASVPKIQSARNYCSLPKTRKTYHCLHNCKVNVEVSYVLANKS